MSKQYAPTHLFAGSSNTRQGVGLPGHCEDCAEHGHAAAHPDLGCADVGCDRNHESAAADALNDALASAEAELYALSAQTKEAYRRYLAYRRYKDLDIQQTTKAAEVRELRQTAAEQGQ